MTPASSGSATWSGRGWTVATSGALLPALLYAAGSALFIPASILFHPAFVHFDAASEAAVAGFVAGSILFCIGGLCNVVSAWRGRQCGLAICGCVGDFLLLTGSVAFIPDLDASEGVVGIQLFRLGSCNYIACSALGLSRMLDERPVRRFECMGSSASILGAALFVGTSVEVLRNNAGHASIAWSVGSLLFFLGAALSILQLSAPSRRQVL